jgi:RNA polymerase sigma-70 factor, ECF subfamily
VMNLASVPRERRGREELGKACLAHLDVLYRLARRLTRHAAEAEDLVQETFARALHASEAFDGGSHLRAWLLRILRNVHLDRWRRERRHLVDLSSPPEESPGEDAWLRGDLELEALRGLVAGEVQAALLHLSEEARMTVLLDLEGFTETEMAETMECAVGTVKSRLSRARTSLRRALAEYAR